MWKLQNWVGKIKDFEKIIKNEIRYHWQPLLEDHSLFINYVKLLFNLKNINHTSWYIPFKETKYYLDSSNNISESFNNKMSHFLTHCSDSKSFISSLGNLQFFLCGLYMEIQEAHDKRGRNLTVNKLAITRFQRKKKFVNFCAAKSSRINRTTGLEIINEMRKYLNLN